MEKLTAKYKLNESQLAALRQIVPEAFKDNELDFNSLYEALSDYIDDDEPDIEQYGLSWPGKRAAKRAAAIPPLGTLAPVPGDGIDEASTRNIYIEGDNLEVLKIIRKAYEGRIKMIYIDPQYNTGSDFIYPDDFSESIESFQKRTGQVDESGVRMTTNNRSDGRFHSKWLSMMYPRLRLARDLLSDDGVILISIDDNEVDNLKNICNEIFGEENFIAQCVWQKFHSVKSNAAYNLSNSHEYVLLYLKQSEKFEFHKIAMSEDALKVYKNPDNDPRGLWRTAPLTVSLLSGARGEAYARTGESTGIYEIIAPNGKKHIPTAGRCWFSKATIEKLRNDNRIWWGLDGNATPMQKIFLEEKGGVKVINSFWSHVEYGSNKKANEEMKELFPELGIALTPKPTVLLKKILEMIDNDAIILDFFSGSATTAHAVMQLNAENSMGGGGTVNSSWYNSKNLAKKTAKPPKRVTKISAKLARNAYAVPGKKSSRKLA
jgi:adenine-specific DNA-methyltransferase